MEKALGVATVLILSSSLAIAQQKREAGKAAATAEDIIELVGAPMSKVFATLGPPDTVDVGDPGQVWLNYDQAFSMLVEKGDKIVACAFWPKWSESVKGIQLTDSQDEMIQKLGKPAITQKNANGMVELVWSFNKQKIDLVARFRDNKCSRIFMPKWGGAGD